MARVRYIGEGETCEVFGQVFHRFQWKGVDHLAADEMDRLAHNPQFEADWLNEAPEPSERGLPARSSAAEESGLEGRAPEGEESVG